MLKIVYVNPSFAQPIHLLIIHNLFEICSVHRNRKENVTDFNILNFNHLHLTSSPSNNDLGILLGKTAHVSTYFRTVSSFIEKSSGVFMNSLVDCLDNRTKHFTFYLKLQSTPLNPVQHMCGCPSLILQVG